MARPLGALAIAATTGVTTVCAWLAVFSAPVNGDESYLLLTLREFGRSGALYDRVYSQYGPFYYSLFGIPARLTGWDWTFTTGRLATLTFWVLAALLLGVAMRAATGSRAIGLGAQVVSFSMLGSLRHEPMHPGSLLMALLGALLWAIAWLRPHAPRSADILTGAILAALLLTKVNVGLFALVAVVLVLVACRPRAIRVLAEIAFVLLGPVVLMAGGVAEWRVLWSSVYVVGAVAVVAVSAVGHRTRKCPDPLPLIWGLVGTALAASGLMLATGSSLGGILRGAFTRPLDHPRLVTVPVRLPPAAWCWIGALPTAWLLLRAHVVHPTPTVRRWSSALRIAAGGGLLLSVLGSDSLLLTLHPEASRFALLPVVALVLVPRWTGGDTPDQLLARALLAALAVTQSLHAFPVPGSQVSWSVVLAGVGAVVIVGDGVRDLATLTAHHDVARWWGAIAAVACVTLVLVVPTGSSIEFPGHQFLVDATQFRHHRPIQLPGTKLLRVPGYQLDEIRQVVPVVQQDCDEIVTLGADLSWYLLADRLPPTGFNQPAWWAYLTDAEQRSVVRAIEPGRRICLLVAPTVATLRTDRLAASASVGDGPLVGALTSRRWQRLAGTARVAVLRAL